MNIQKLRSKLAVGKLDKEMFLRGMSSISRLGLIESQLRSGISPLIVADQVQEMRTKWIHDLEFCDEQLQKIQRRAN